MRLLIALLTLLLSCYQVIKPQDRAVEYNDNGLRLLEAGKPQDAIEQFSYAIEVSPEFAGAWNNLGLAYFYAGMTGMALQALERALELDYKMPEARNNLGVVLKELGEVERARSEFRRAIKLNRDYAEPYFHLGVISAEEEKWSEAREYFEHALDIAPEFAEAGKNLGMVYIRLGMFDRAVIRLRITLELAPDSDETHDALGYALFLKGERESALNEFSAAINLNAGEQAYFLHRGICLMELSRLAEAEEDFKTARGLNDKTQEPLILLSLIKLKSGAKDAAVKLLEGKSLELMLRGINNKDSLVNSYAEKLLEELKK